MSSSTLPVTSSPAPDHAVWDSLKQAIASSSGFQQWKQESDPAHSPTAEMTPAEDLEGQVRGYLRETLETLAY